MAGWVQWTVAVAIFLAIVAAGLVFLRGIAGSRPRERIEPEDVAELDVFFVCLECGTEFKVTRIGEVQVPRHCGEPMAVVRRPRPQPELDGSR
jgi:predicted small integral membrane protein